jgi:hypothetical protein
MTRKTTRYPTPVYRIEESLTTGIEAGEDALESMVEVANTLETGRDTGTLLMLFDAMAPNIESWLAAADDCRQLWRNR